ncbi:MAG: HNH endonuclease signature motif containing protein [Candidatus Eisenbacteria bacterium]
MREEHRASIGVLDVLGEVDRRSLYLDEGYSSLFDFCTRRWMYSPATAARYIAAARAVARYPVVRRMLLERRLTVCGVARIASSLSPENHRELTSRAAGKTYVEIEALVGARRTAPRVPDRVRVIGTSPRGTARREAATLALAIGGDRDSDRGRERIGGVRVGRDIQSQGRKANAGETAADSAGSGEGGSVGATGIQRGCGGDAADVSNIQRGCGGDATDVSNIQRGCGGDAADVSNIQRGCGGDAAGFSNIQRGCGGDAADVSNIQRGCGDGTDRPNIRRGSTALADPDRADRECPATAPELRYEIRFSARQRFVEKLERAKAVCSSFADLEGVLERALDDLLDRRDPERRAKRRATRLSKGRVERRDGARVAQSEGASPAERAVRLTQAVRTADAAGPSGGCDSAQEDAGLAETVASSFDAPGAQRPSRHIPSDVRDSVFLRDGGKCTYVGPSGVRCNASVFLQYDHVERFSRGGSHSVENLRLLCGKHNRRREAGWD